MQIAFGIVSVFLNGGLQRNCLAIARILQERGHRVTLFAARSDGPLPSDVPIKIIPNSAWTNHGRDLRFARDFSVVSAAGFDRTVGFNKLLDVDILYCADPPAGARAGALRRLTPRYRTRHTLEASSYALDAKPLIIALSQTQIDAYRRNWHTPAERFVLLPPNLERDRKHPEARTDGTRERSRIAFGLREHEWCWLAVGRQPRTKGFDRAVAALPAFPNARLLIMGLDSAERGGKDLLRKARRAGAEGQVKLLGFVPDQDVPALMAAADLLIHPARSDITGTVILEAIINGLPVVTTAACGYAPHVRAAEAGLVVPEPFAPEALRLAMSEASHPERRAEWSSNGIRYGGQADLFSGLQKAADVIVGGISR
jgi:UDP-glucose:(heptosyl)LPS alpha-1,3-glucosyltransferase